MNADEYRNTLKRLDDTQVGSAAFFGVSGVTSRGWGSGKAGIPEATAMLLRLMLAMKLSPEKVKEWLADA